MLYWLWKRGEWQEFDSMCKTARSTGRTHDRIRKKSEQKVNRKSSNMWERRRFLKGVKDTYYRVLDLQFTEFTASDICPHTNKKKKKLFLIQRGDAVSAREIKKYTIPCKFPVYFCFAFANRMSHLGKAQHFKMFQNCSSGPLVKS